MKPSLLLAFGLGLSGFLGIQSSHAAVVIGHDESAILGLLRIEDWTSGQGTTATGNGVEIRYHDYDPGQDPFGIGYLEFLLPRPRSQWGIAYRDGSVQKYMAGFMEDHSFVLFSPTTDLVTIELDPDASEIRLGGDPVLTRGATFSNGFAFTGSYSSGETGANLSVSGAGTRVLWYPERGAFRAGQVTGTQWDASNIGAHSVAFGYNTRASGAGSFAAGTGSIASGAGAIAFGGSSTASGVQSFAFGTYVNAIGVHSFAMGNDVHASGSHALTFGLESYNNAAYSVSLGAYNYTSPSASGSFVFGSDNYVSSVGGIVLGGTNGIGSSAGGSVAIGYDNFSSAPIGVAIGLSNGVSETYAVAIGVFNESYGNASVAIGLGNQAAREGATATGRWTLASGEASLAANHYTTAASYAGSAFGRYNIGGGSPTTWEAEDPLFEIGIGTSSSNRANAVTVRKDGEVTIVKLKPQGDILMGEFGP